VAVIVIGGHSRRVGKTSVVAGIIASLPEYGWSAFKISQHGHGLKSTGAGEKAAWAISEETDRAGDSDTSRFLAAGAERAFWVRTKPNRLVEAMPMVHRKLVESKNAILESNTVLRFLRPDLYMLVIDPATTDFKSTAQKFLDCADAVILHRRPGHAGSERMDTMLKPRANRPVFLIGPPEYVTPEIVEFVRKALVSQDGVGGR
jgi:hypothetical protein